MSWRVEWLEEAAKDMRKLGKAEQKQVLKGIAKVSENPLPSSQGGYGKPLRNATAPIWPDCAKSSSGTLESEWYTSRFSRKEPWSSSS